MSINKLQCGVSTGGEMVASVNGLIDANRAQNLALSSQKQGVGREYPTVTKAPFNPLFEVADQTANSLLWPWIVDMREDGGEGVALFWSTDHAADASSGIWMATADSPDGVWTQHGKIFQDTVNGEQTETPSVMWDEVNSRWLMYYQLKFVSGFNNQITFVATTPTIMNGAVPNTWTVLGIAANESYIDNAGDGHTGYFKPYRYDGAWYAFGLYGGTNYSRFAFWTSNNNGRNFTVHPEILQWNQNLIQHLDGFDYSNWLISHNRNTVIERNGQLWVITMVGGAAAGGVDPIDQRVCAMRLSKDGVTFGKAIDITPTAEAWELPNGVDGLGNTLRWEDKLYLTHRSNTKDGGFGLMEIV